MAGIKGMKWNKKYYKKEKKSMIKKMIGKIKIRKINKRFDQLLKSWMRKEIAKDVYDYEKDKLVEEEVRVIREYGLN